MRFNRSLVATLLLGLTPMAAFGDAPRGDVEGILALHPGAK